MVAVLFVSFSCRDIVQLSEHNILHIHDNIHRNLSVVTIKRNASMLYLNVPAALMAQFPCGD